MRKNDIFAAINNTNMGSWTIYNKSGVAKAVVKELELHDEWMAECYLTITVKSAQPISFAVGDYIDYRNERYTIEYDPNEIKRSTSGTYGEGFVYENIKFVGAQDEVVRCDFNDIVLSDNNVHYTALPTFPFYCESVDDLLDRIQANLEDLYPNGWIVIGLNTVRNYQRGNIVGRAAAFEVAYRQWVDPDLTPRTDPYGKQSVAETADNITCWDALTKVHDDFGLNFIVRGKVIIVGTAGVFTANTFRYGKGNGLSEIEKLGDSSQQIVTRLRAYGSETNMPLHYYSAINMLPYGLAVDSTTDGNVQIDVDFKKEYFVHEFSSGETDVVAKVGDTSYNAKAYINSSTGKINLNLRVAVSVTANAKVYITEGVKRDMWPSDHKDYAQGALPENMAVSRLMLPMFPNQSLYDWVKAHRDTGTTYDDATGRATYHGYTAYFSKEPQRPYIDSLNKDDYGIRPASIYFDGSNDTVDIHPTIEGMTYNSNPVDVIYVAEQIDDNGVYDDSSVTVPNFNITLPNLGFNLAEVYEENASIDVKDGMCGGRSFKIASKPTQDANGRWVCECQRAKDDSLALFFPYNDFQIASGDHYVLTGIQLPDEYISAASVRMVDAALDALFKNHAPRLTYQPKIDYNFMQRQHDSAMASQSVVSLHDTLKAGDVFVFADADMGIDKSVIIDQLTIKENGEKGIPTYEISLRDEKDVSPIQKLQNKIDSVISGAININSGVAGLTAQQVRSLINNFGGAQFLSKLNDDTAAGYITMLKGLQIGANFVPDILGEGGVLRMRQDGKVELVTDILYARMKAYFDSVEIREYQHTGGNRIASVAGNKICRVAWYNSSNVELEQTQANLASVAYFRCYFRASDGEDTVRNNWVIGDQAYCHITSVTTSSDNPEEKGLNQKHLWRLVIGRNTEGTLTEDGEAYIDLSNRTTETISGTSYTGYQSGSDVPEAQDDIIQLGNVNDTTRQGAIVEFVTGTDAPSYQIYQGINSFSLNGKNQIGFGYNTGTGRAYLNVYGDFRFGARPNTQGSYLEYNSQTGALNIKAHVEFTNSDQELDSLVQAHQRDDSYDDTEVRGLIDGLQNQIDGQIESWFYNYAPVDVDSQGAPTSTTPLNVAPYSDWTTDNDKIAHLGDTFTNNATGYCWRFSRNSTTNAFEWVIIEDSAVITALQNAARAQDTADHKRRVFLTQPVPPYDAGDMWVNAVYPANYTGVTDEANHNYNNDILKCVTAKASDGSFSINDWALASKYTDDSKFNGYISALLNNTGLSGDSAAAAVQNAILGALGVGTVVAGGLLLTSLIGMRQYNGSGDKSDVSNYTTWAGISGQYNANVLGGGMAAWYGGGMLDKETLTEPQISQGWSALRWAKGVDRFDGSGYRADGNISWDANGALTIKNITTLSDTNNNNILNELATFNSAFTFGTSGQGSTTALYITPQVPFESLYVGTSNANKQEVATKNWVNQNFVTTTFFDNIFRLYNGTESASNKIAVNGTLPTDKTNLNIEAMFGFWTKKYISALGQGDDGSTSYTTLAQLNDVTLTNPTANQILVYDGTHWVNATAPTTYVLPQATANALGGIKIGYNDATPKTYAVALNSAGQAYVAVPWENTTYTLAGLMGSTAIGGTTQPIYWNGSAFANTTYTLGKSVPSDAVFTDHYAWGDITNKPSAAGNATTPVYWTGSGFTTCTAYANASVSYATSAGSATSANTATKALYLLTNDTSQAADDCYDGAAGLRFWRYNGTSSTTGQTGGDGWILSWSWDVGSVGGQIYLDDNPSKTICIRGYNNTTKDFTTWATLLHSDNYTAYTVKKDGTGASGSWGISITGNAATATSATTASKLSTVSKTLFGNTYWTSGGVPTSIGVSGSNASLSYVQNISMSGYIKIGDAYLSYDSTNNAIRVSANANGTGAVNFYAVGGVSALGETADGQAGVGDVTWALLADGTDTRQIALSHLTTSLTTITGGTTDSTNKKYAVYKNSSNQLFVDVPWTAGSGTVTSVKVGTTSYTPTNGVISLPAYPTSLPASDVYSWAKESSKPSYSWSEIGSRPTALSQFTNDSGYITSSGSCAYATSAGNADTLDGYHYNGLPYLPVAQVTEEQNNDNPNWVRSYAVNHRQSLVYNTSGREWAYWIGMRSSDTSYGTILRLSHDGLVEFMYKGGGGDNDNWSNWKAIITQNNIGSQSVSYATSAGSVAWGNVSGRPTALSQFTNDSGFITSSALSSYLPLSGGTLTSTAGGILTLNNTHQVSSERAVFILFDYNGTNKADVGYSQNFAYVSNNVASGARIGVNDSGIPQYWTTAEIPNQTVYNLIHSGGGTFTGNLFYTVGGLTFNLLKQSDYNIDIGWDYNNRYGAGLGLRSSSYSTESEKGAFVLYVRDASHSYNLVGTNDGLLSWEGNFRTSTSNGAYVQVGAVRLVYDSTNNAIKVIKSDGTAANFYATGGVSALGVGQESGGGGNYLPLSGGTLTNSTIYSVLKITNTYNSPWGHGIEIEFPNQPISSYQSSISFGVDTNENNEGVIAFGYFGNNSTNNAISLGFNANDHLFYLQASGNVGIGTISPERKLDVYGTIQAGETYKVVLENRDDGGSLTFWGTNWLKGYIDAANIVMQTYSGGNVGIGTNPSYKLHVAGAVGATGFTNTSDIRTKNVIKDVDLRLDQIAKAPSFEYYWLDQSIDHDLHVGTSAQYWESVLPQVVTTAKDEIGTKAMQYGVAALISAITVARKVMTHEEKIALLETRVSALEKENGEQEQLINSLQKELEKFKAA